MEKVLQFKPIRHGRVSGEVLAQLKGAILNGQFPAGEKLPSERELTEQFQVSRGVVREALRALEMTGFVAIRQGPNGGAFVTELTSDNLSGGFLDLYLANKLTIPELNEVRKHIEPEVARLAALNVNDPFRERLKNALLAEWDPSATPEERMKRLTAVHFILAEMCGNYLFTAIVNSMIRLTHEIVAVVGPTDHTEIHGAGEHESLVNAVMAGDAEAAERTMRSHLDTFCRGLVKMDGTYRGTVRPERK